MPDPVGNGTAGSLGQNLEFLYLKAQLETAVELQSLELRHGRQELHAAQLEIQTLKDRLDHKEVVLQQMNAQLKSKLRVEDEFVPELKVESKHRIAWLKQLKEKNRQWQEETSHRSQDLLMFVLKKHQRQTQRRWGKAEAPQVKAESAELNEMMTQRASHRTARSGTASSGTASALDRSVASKGVPIVDDIVDAGEDVVNEITDGTGLVGDALSDAYNQATDKAAFVANTVIDTVEQAVAILSQGFDFSADCPNWQGPSLSVSDSDISVDWGRQRCRVTLVGETLTLFDMNFGSTSVAYPAPLTAMISVGQQVSGCLSNGNALDVFKCTAKAIGDELLADVPAFKILFALAEHVAGCTGDALDVFTCTAAKVGDVLLQRIPPFNLLTNLGTMLSEFIAFFAELASALIHTLLSETSSLMQVAVNSSFPRAGEQPLQLAGPKGLTARLSRRQSRAPPRRPGPPSGSAPPASVLQREADRKPSNDVDNGIVGFGSTEAQPYASMLITQFGGDEIDSGSCLAFAPRHRTGSAGNVTKRDWQVPSPESEDFVKLEPWAVPCDNQWAKDNPSKWEGYSFYTYESVIEKCAAITYSMSAQPVISFVGGLEFDLLPAPLMEITTEEEDGDLGVHELFELGSPSGSLVGFNIKGELSSGVMQLKVHISFGPVESPTKTIPLIDLVDNLRVVLAALPFVSQASKQKAIDAMGNTHFDLELPSAEFLGSLPLVSGVTQASGHVRDAVFERKEGICSVQAALKPTTWRDVAILPAECHPSGSLVFNLMTASKIASVEVDSRGVITWMEGSQDSWLSLAGLVFPAVSPGWPIELQNGWENAPAPYAPASYTLVGSLCFVEGRIVSSSSWGVLAHLPEDCRPTKRLTFNLNGHGAATSEIEVLTNGEVIYSAGPQTSWLSLSGIIFVTTKGVAHAKSLELAGGWVASGGVPTYSMTLGHCLVEGQLDGILLNGGAKLATLPVECWPMRKLIFSKAYGTNNIEVDVSEFGEISYSGTEVVVGAARISLSGLLFSAPSDGRRMLPTVGAWVASFTNQWGEGAFIMKNGFCMLEARPTGGSLTPLSVIAHLPEGCRPTKRLTFNVNHHDFTHSVDVTPEGSVVWMDGHAKYTWVSLSGITFAPGDVGRITLPLVNGWTPYGLEYGIPEVTKRNGICSVEGRLFGGGWQKMAQLPPEECTPSKRLIFNMNNLDKTSRVDVQDDGIIRWYAGGSSYNWISLSGMIIVPDESNAVPLELANGHPENFETDGIEVTTGPLGMGISNAVGLAAAEAHLAAVYNKPGMELIDHYTYTIAGDGCMQEGISHEACAYAGHLGLGKLIAFYDDNGITIDGHTDLSFTEDVGKRFEAYGWQVLEVPEGNTDVDAIRKAIKEAKACTDKPTLIKALQQHENCWLEFDVLLVESAAAKADSHDAHGAPLGADEAEATRKQLGWNYGEFEVPDQVYDTFRKHAKAGSEKQAAWNKMWKEYQEKEPELAAQFKRAVMDRKLPDNWTDALPKVTPEDKGKATRAHELLAARAASQDCLNAIANVLPEFMGGSADLAPSNMTLMKCTGDFLKDSYSERNMRFGIREFGMGAVSNALSLDKTGIIPYCATFTIFTDYMRGAIRIAALSQAGTIFVTTHDSIAVGEDGPTHQPIETLPSLRLIPDLTVMRPADGNETAGAYKLLGSQHGTLTGADAFVGIDVFGASAPGGTCLDKFGFNVDNVVSCAERRVKQPRLRSPFRREPAGTEGAELRTALAATAAVRPNKRCAKKDKVVRLATATEVDVDTECINAIRFLAVDAVNKANSGHPGAPMGQAPIGYLLFAEEMQYNPEDPKWVNRDRFVLSSGHGCMLQYSLLHLAGYDSVSIDDIKQFRQWGSKTPGHPENFETDGIEVKLDCNEQVFSSSFRNLGTTGPLGMGISNAVGLAAAEAHLAAVYNKPGMELIDHYTYTIAGDGCMQEGISHEACAYAGHLGLGKLIAFYDDNGITIDGHTDLSFTEDVGKRFEGYGWQVLEVPEGNTDVDAIRKAIKAG
eukprot:g30267.t1